MLFGRTPSFATLLHRVTAAVSVAMVCVLGLLTVSPEAHAWLHRHVETATCAHGHAHDHSHGTEAGTLPESHDDEGCVVQLFAQGVDVGVAALILDTRWQEIATEAILTPEELSLSPPRYLRRPERGPPV